MELHVVEPWMMVKAFVLAIQQIVGDVMPKDLYVACRWHPARRQLSQSDIDTADLALQEWAADKCPRWMTGFGCIEAAELLVETSIENDSNWLVANMNKIIETPNKSDIEQTKSRESSE